MKILLVCSTSFYDKIPPIKPEHLREARRRMLQRKILPTVKMKYLFQDK